MWFGYDQRNIKLTYLCDRGREFTDEELKAVRNNINTINNDPVAHLYPSCLQNLLELGRRVNVIYYKY